MYSEMMKGQDALHPSVTPEQVADMVVSSISGMELADADSLNEVRQALLHMIQRMAEYEHNKQAQKFAFIVDEFLCLFHSL